MIGRNKALLVIYGNWLVEKREFNKAGQGLLKMRFFFYVVNNVCTAFARAGDSKRAMFAFEKARMWKELFSLALDTGIAPEDLVDMGYRVAGTVQAHIISHVRQTELLIILESLASHLRYSEAARVYLDYAHHVSGAVTALSSGNDLSEAFRVVGLTEYLSI